MIKASIVERRKVVRKQIATTAISKSPSCVCNNCNTLTHKFKCQECLRTIPWCHGGSGDGWEQDACDTCWSIITDGGTIEVTGNTNNTNTAKE